MTGKQLKNSILQWAIQGKLVPQDPNDEPASVLLEKIRAEKDRLIKEGKIKRDKKESIIYRGDDNSYYEKFANGKVVCINDEIPFEIPDIWCWSRLGHIFEHNTGKALNSSNQTGQLKTYITTSNLYWNYFNLTSLKQMYFSDSEIAKYTVTKGDLLVCEGGDIGRAAIWNYEYDICIQNHIHRLRAYIDIETKFFYYIFLLYKGLGYIGGKGIGIQGLSSGALHNILVPVPSVSEQFRITAYFEQIEPIIDKYNATQTALNSLNTDIYVQLRKSILQEAIQGKLVAQNPEEEPASILLQRIRDEKLRLVKESKLKKKDVVDSIIFKGDDNKYFEKKGREIVCIDEEIPFEIPDTWIWTRLSNVCHITNGFTPLRTEDSYWHNGTINWFTVEDLREQGEYISYTKQKITKEATSKERIVRAGSTLLCCTASVGQCAFSKIPLTTNQQFNALTVKQEHIPVLNDDFLFLFAKTLEDKLHKLSGKTTFEFVSVKKVCNILIPIPPFSEQIRIVNVTNKALASIMSR